MIGLEDAPQTYEYEHHFKILPMIHQWSVDPSRIKAGIKVSEDFSYSSENNQQQMSVKDLQDWIASNKNKLGQL
jgi:hypothetical protein